MTLKFYTRPECSLCNQALALLAEAGLGQTFAKVNIDDEPELTERYGDKIPVLHNTRSGEILCWPFTASQVHNLIAD